MEKRNELYSGKVKTIYATDDKKKVIMHFRDDATAFDGVKHEKLQRKGMVNNHFNAFIMEKLAAAGVGNHFEKVLNDNDSLVKHLDMLPLECIVRNIAAGSLCRRYGIKEGLELNPPLYELCYKSDELHDPFINECHARAFDWASDEELVVMQQQSIAVNNVLKPLFLEAGMLLVDYKLEFGRFGGEILLGDEFTPDGCRVWDAETREILDKDRFRKDMGDVVESYEIIAKRLGVGI